MPGGRPQTRIRPGHVRELLHRARSGRMPRQDALWLLGLLEQAFREHQSAGSRNPQITTEIARSWMRIGFSEQMRAEMAQSGERYARDFTPGALERDGWTRDEDWWIPRPGAAGPATTH